VKPEVAHLYQNEEGVRRVDRLVRSTLSTAGLSLSPQCLHRQNQHHAPSVTGIESDADGRIPEEEMEPIAEVVISRKVTRRGKTPVTGPVLRLGPLILEGCGRINMEIVQPTARLYEKAGVGFHEGVYQACMAQDQARRILDVRREVPFLLEYEGLSLNHGYRLDLLVEDWHKQ
jgi:hypothetical protein